MHAPIKVALKHDALVFPGKHLGMFPDRYVIEGSIDHRIMTTTPEQHLARAEELIELGRQNLPLLEAQDRTEAARAGKYIGAASRRIAMPLGPLP